MAEQYQQHSTQLQSPNAPQTAFGDYRGLSSIARAADTVSRVSMQLKQRHDQRQLSKFQVTNKEFVDELLTRDDLEPHQIIEEYDKFYESAASELPEEYHDQMKMSVYYRTLGSTDFKNRIATLEIEKNEQAQAEVNASYRKDWISGSGVTAESFKTWKEASAAPDFIDPRAKAQYEAAQADMETTALLNADSLEEFDAIVDQLEYIKNGSQITSLRKRVESEMGRLADGVVSELKKTVTNAKSIAENPTIAQTEDDMWTQEELNHAIEIGAPPEMIQEMLYTNMSIKALKSKSHYNKEYFSDFADPEKMQNKLLSMGFDQEYIDMVFKDKTQIQNFQKLSKYYSDLGDADRAYKNPLVQKFLAEGKRRLAMDTVTELMGGVQYDEEGKPKLPPDEYMGYDTSVIIPQMIPKDWIRDFYRQWDPKNKDRDALKRARADLYTELGQEYAQAFDVALTRYMIQDWADSEDHELGAYYALASMGDDRALDMLYDGYNQGERMRDNFLAKSDSPGKVESRIADRLFDDRMLAFIDYFEGMDTPINMAAFKTLLTNTVYAKLEENPNLSINQAVSALKEGMTSRYYLIKGDAFKNTLLLPRDYQHIPAVGPIDRALEYGYGLWNRMPEEYEKNWVQERLISRGLDQIFENPRGRQSYSPTSFPRVLPGGLYGVGEMLTPGAAKNVGIFFSNAFNQLAKIAPVAGRAVGGQHPFTIYDPEKYYWEGAPNDSGQDMFLRTAKGWFYPEGEVIIEQGWGPKGQLGFHVFVQPSDPAKPRVPLMQRSADGNDNTAFITLNQILVPEQ